VPRGSKGKIYWPRFLRDRILQWGRDIQSSVSFLKKEAVVWESAENCVLLSLGGSSEGKGKRRPLLEAVTNGLMKTQLSEKRTLDFSCSNQNCYLCVPENFI
jgi:hypothetical protein